MPRMKKVAIAVLLIFISGTARAHDLYLTVQNNQICAGIGEAFPVSENAVTADRLNSFRVFAMTTSASLEGNVVAKQFCAPAPVAKAYMAEMTVQPRFIKLAAKDFAAYTHGEGLNDVEEARKRNGQSEADGRELYSRYSKLLVGRLEELASKPVGHALEIVPQRDPSTLKPGDQLPIVVLFKGKPLADAQVSAVYANAKLTGHEYPVTTRTDSEGKASLKLDRSGLWYARITYMQPAKDDPEVDWRSYFSTVTFEISTR